MWQQILENEAHASYEARLFLTVGRIRFMASGGMTVNEMAQALGCTRQNVHALCKRHGIRFDSRKLRLHIAFKE